MAGTLTIPLVTLPAGAHVFPASGGHPVADTDTAAALSIDRTPAGGFNAVSAQVTALIAVLLSRDGGATWDQVAAGGVAGGPVTDRASGGPATVSNVAVTPAAGTGRLARAQVTVAGGPVAVQGTLTVT